MSRIANRPRRRRKPPWTAAARSGLRRLAVRPEADAPQTPEPATRAQPRMVRVYADRTHRGSPPSTAEMVGAALLEMAAPDLAALGPWASLEDLDRIVDAALFAYNQPIQDPATAELVPLLRDALDMVLHAMPGFRARHERMLKVRTERFGHLKAHVMMCWAGFADRGGVYIDVMVPPEGAVPDA